MTPASTENEQDANKESSKFENGYWCLKDGDCITKKCAQVGPRKYDKECRDEDFVDFVVEKKKKPRRHHREEETFDKKAKEVKEADQSQKQEKEAIEEAH